MSIFILCAAALTGGVFSMTPLDGGSRIVLSSTRPAADSKGVRCRWTVYKDALPAASGLWPVEGLGADSPITNAAPAVLRELKGRGGDLALRVRFVTGEDDPKKEKLLAIGQVDYPRSAARPLSAYAGAPATLTETADAYEFKTSSTRIRFDRQTGLVSGFATGWWSLTEWMKRPMVFDFGDPAPRIRLETFGRPVETNGVWSFRTVSWWTLSDGERRAASPTGADGGAASRNFEIRLTTDWAVRGDGRVVSSTAVRPFGLRHLLPRVGWAFVLAPPDPLVQYYGADPAADSADRSCEGLTGLYEATAAGCGTHERTRAVAFDAGSDHLAFSTLGGDFTLEVGRTPSKGTFCGLAVARHVETDRDWKIDFLISPEKVLKAMAMPVERTGDAKPEAGAETKESGQETKP